MSGAYLLVDTQRNDKRARGAMDDTKDSRSGVLTGVSTLGMLSGMAHSENYNHIDLGRDGMYCTCGAGEFMSYNGLAKHVAAARRREEREALSLAKFA